MFRFTLNGDILMDKKKVLFVCVHNSARSQMAEAFLKQMAGDRFEVESAGLEPGKLNPAVVEVMKEVGIDISQNKTKSVFDFYKAGKKYDYVITVCDESQAGQCPIFPGGGQKLHWGFKDPSGFQGSWEERIAKTRKIRDQIEKRIKEWIKQL
jgi:arsenate reductase